MYKNFYTTAMCPQKKMLEKRFSSIRSIRKPKKALTFIGFFTALVLLTTSVFASGMLQDTLYTPYTITVTNNGETLALSHTPFVENNAVYLPLREVLASENITDITYRDGVIQILVYAETPGSILYQGQVYDAWFNEITIGDTAVALAGYSSETAANDTLQNPPLLVEDTTYVPYEFFEKLEISGQNVFTDFSVQVLDREGDPIPTGALYENADLAFSLEIPLGWNGKYMIENAGATVYFYQKDTHEKYGAGTLFYIERIPGNPSQDEISAPGSRKIILQTNEYTYVLGTPTDVQYPIWVDRDEADVQIAAAYEAMFRDIENIGNSIRPISPSQDFIQAQNTAAAFFAAFEQRDFATMRTYCTQNCINSFFGDGYVFGMETAKLQSIQLYPTDHMTDENTVVLLVTAKITASPMAVFGDIDTHSFFLILQKQADGSYLIDEFASGV